MSGLTADCKRVDEELDRQFGSPAPALSEPARRHLDECERCRKLNEWIGHASSSSSCRPETLASVHSRLSASLNPVSARPPLSILVFRFGIVVVSLALLAIGFMRRAGFSRMNVPQLIGITIVLLAGVMLLAVCLAWEITPGSLRRVSATMATAMAAGGFAACVLLLFPWWTPEAFFARGWPCLGEGLGLAGPAALLLWLVARRGALPGTGAFGGLLGAMAGLAGASVLQFACDRQEGEHLLFWHGGVLLISMAAGFLIAHVLSYLKQREA